MRGFTDLDNSNHKGKTNTWLTPKYLIDELGDFDLDPCAAPLPRPWPTAKKMISLPDDGLSYKWEGRVWLNPPYGKHTGIWLDRLAKHGNGVALVFARTDTKWFQKAAKSADKLFFLKGRVKFCRPDGTSDTNAGHGSVLIFYGNNLNHGSLEGVAL